MKIDKIILGFIFGLFIWSCFDLFSLADGIDYPMQGAPSVATWSYDYQNGNTTNYVRVGRKFMSAYPLVFYSDGNGAGFPVCPLPAGSYQSYRYTVENPTIEWGDSTSISWNSYTYNDTVYRYGTTGFNYAATNPIWNNFHVSMSNIVMFDSLEHACAYLDDPTSDPDGIIEGEEIVNNGIISWGDNNPAIKNEPDTDNIPAPKFEVVKDSTGNHSIKFTNQIYNYSDHGVYGIVLKGNWDSFDTFTMKWKSNFSDEYNIYYDNLLNDNVIFTMYDVPIRKNDIVRCPATINFETQTNSLNAFNAFLSRNPVANRTISFSNGNSDNNLEATARFRSYLGGISCPYNTCVFSCFYYRQMSDGTYHYGPETTASFSIPSQGAIYKYGGVYNPDDPGIVDPNPIIIPGPTPGPNPDPIINPGSSDPKDLYENMQGLLGFIGQVPQLIGQIFTFLPQWLIVFIAVAIGLMVAIGVVKLFLG